MVDDLSIFCHLWLGLLNRSNWKLPRFLSDYLFEFFGALIMVIFPLFPTLITELMLTAASHVVATLSPLNDKSTFFTSSKLEVVCKFISIVVITLTIVIASETFRAIFCSTDVTVNGILVKVNQSFAVLLGTKFSVFASCYFKEQQNFIVFFSWLLWQFFYNRWFFCQNIGAIHLQTTNFFKGVNLVPYMFFNANIAKRVTTPIAEKQKILFGERSQANRTLCTIPDLFFSNWPSLSFGYIFHLSNFLLFVFEFVLLFKKSHSLLTNLLFLFELNEIKLFYGFLFSFFLLRWIFLYLKSFIFLDFILIHFFCPHLDIFMLFFNHK